MLPTAYPIAMRDPTDVVGRRIAASAIDYGLAIALAVTLFFTLSQTVDHASAAVAEDHCENILDTTNGFCVALDTTSYEFTENAAAAILLLPLLYLFLNDALLTGLLGFSLGKGLLGLRVVRQESGLHCGVGRAMVRWVFWITDGQPCGFPLVALITALSSKGHRRVGDMVAKTFVVAKESVGRPPVVPGLTVPFGPWAPHPGAGYPPPTAPPPPTGSPHPGPPPVAVPPAPMPGVDAPLWDEARDAYIQWDPDLEVWVQWDEHAHEWRPIR